MLQPFGCSIYVGVLGFEPRMTGPESVVLPLHHTPISMYLYFACKDKATFEILQEKESEKTTFSI